MGEEFIVILSHSGIDTENARELKRRIETSPSANRVALKVWFDKDDNGAGKQWQRQLKREFQDHCIAFEVRVG